MIFYRSPLSPRTFVELVIAKGLPPIPGKLPPGFHTNHLPRPCRQFMVISLPIDDRNSSLPSPPYSADMGTPGSSTPTSPGSSIATPDSVVSPTTPAASRPSLNGRVSTSTSGGKDKTVRARYVSAEWVREVDLQLAGFEHGEIDGGPRVVRGVEWIMATSSSAGGEWSDRGKLHMNASANVAREWRDVRERTSSCYEHVSAIQDHRSESPFCVGHNVACSMFMPLKLRFSS